MLSMSYKDNAEHLGKGSGVNLSSARKPSHGSGASGTQQPPASTDGPEGSGDR